MVQFLKEVKLLIPNSHRMNRGGNTVAQVMETCKSDGFSDLVILQEHRGVPDGLVVSHMPYGPTAYFGLHNVVMRHDIPQARALHAARKLEKGRGCGLKGHAAACAMVW